MRVLLNAEPTMKDDGSGKCEQRAQHVVQESGHEVCRMCIECSNTAFLPYCTPESMNGTSISPMRWMRGLHNEPRSHEVKRGQEDASDYVRGKGDNKVGRGKPGWRQRIYLNGGFWGEYA